MMRIRACAWAATTLVMVATGCSDEETTNNSTSNPTSSSTGATGPGGSGGNGAAGAEGGAGGTGGGTGGGNVGGGGAGGGAACLAAAETDAYFTIASSVLCAVARYDAPALTVGPYGISPTWGVHEGLLTYGPSANGITLQRWAVDGTSL